MRVLHLSWEYPPVMYGGLGRHVHALAETQAACGHEVVVVTQAPPGERAEELVNGVRVMRVPHDAPFLPEGQGGFIAWCFGLNTALARGAIGVLQHWRPDVVHGHDWLVAQASVLVQEAFAVPFVLTVHATEAGRHHGDLATDQSWAIHSTEWWVTGLADGVIVCSRYMREQVTRLFDLDPDVVSVIPNGIDPASWRVTASHRDRAREELGSPLVAFAGRLEPEKGVHTLLDALPIVRRRVPGVRAVVMGVGGSAAWLHERARERRVSSLVRFTGWVPEADLRATVAAADAAVVPSLYEPFGFVALEAMALGAPVVVARTGGLAEIVDAGRTGWCFEPGDPRSLADELIDVLGNRSEARRRARAARRAVLHRYGWPAIVAQTDDAYAAASVESAATRRRPAYAPRPGNLLDPDHR
ncbi:MAG: glycosyltransferase family 4 protein [Candidatus Nanopelagicales bacterium]